MSETGIGARVKRKEDKRFLTGRGQYTDDVSMPGQAHAYFLRSPLPHARIKGVDKSAAEAAPGVVGVLSGADVTAAGLGGLPCGWGITQPDGSAMFEPPHPIIATDKVRYVGDPVAVVFAETLAQAKDAAELINVDYEELPGVAQAVDALKPGAPAVFDDKPDNICFDWELGDGAATDAALAGAHKVVKVEVVNNRLIPNAMEPRAAVAGYEAGTDETTLYLTSQNPHVIRLLLGAFVFAMPEHKFRVVAPDVGGGFGSKIFPYNEEAVLIFGAKTFGRPMKWVAERSESFMSDAHGRDHVSTAEIGLDANGKFVGLRTNTVANLGAYLSTFGPGIPTWFYATLLSGMYVIPVINAKVRAVFTNTVPVDAYRGAGRPEASYLIERVVNAAAAEMGMDPAEIRRINFIKPDQFPYETPVGMTYDSGNYEATLNLALKHADYAGFEQRRQEAASRGKYRGIGLSTFVEACGAAPSAVAGALGARAGLYESAEVRFHATGSVSVFTGTHSHGQGHETTFAQLVSERFGIPIENVDIVHGDTARIQFGMGSYGSRSLPVGGTAIVKAMDKVVEKGKKIAAHLMEASVEDIEFSAGNFSVAGTDKSVNIGEIAFAAHVPHNYPLEELEPGLDEQAFWDPPNFTFPGGCYICEVEVDPDTGRLEIVQFTAADDVGVIVNPMIVEGQIQGGIAQGVGQALLEACAYDADGQLVSGSYMDYCMPRADDLPSITFDVSVTPSPTNPLGVKGCGEVGAIGSPPAVINAIIDALKPLGVDHIDMPATPQRIWKTIQAASAQAAE